MATKRLKPVELLTDDELRRLMAATSRRGKTGRRNRALIAILYGSGARIAEALALQPRDLDRGTGDLLIRRGKGGKQRRTALPAGELAIVLDWLSYRRTELGIGDAAPIVCTLAGESVYPSYVWRMLQRLRSRAGIERRLHAHGFRHLFACKLAASRVPVVDVSSLLGHSSIGTTSTYLTGLLGRPEALDAARSMSWGVVAVPTPTREEARHA